MMTKEMILNAIENNDFEFYGLRYDFNNYNLNDTCENSHQWFADAWNLDNYDELTEEEISELYNSEMMCYDNGELNGTCSIRVTSETIEQALEDMKMYELGYLPEGAELILIAGDFAEEGNDKHEIIIENAVVIAK